MFEVNVPNKAVGEAVEVIDKVEEPGVDAKVVEGWIADIDPDLARSQLLEEPPGRRRWWCVRGERICWRSAGGLPEVCRRSAERCRRMW